MAYEGEAMIEFTSGDMFQVPADVRVNTVNCKGVMGAGVALAFKNRYPEMFKDYQTACRDGRVRPGALHVWKSLTGDWVINFPTKRDWRDPSNYEDIRAGLEALRKYLLEHGKVSVALPALGCGNGGLDWDKVAPMIIESLGDLDARILVFAPQDSRAVGQAAQNSPTEEQISAVRELGFEFMDGRDGNSAEPRAPIFVKGDTTLLARPWIAVLPSNEPTERELTALDAVAHQLARSAQSCSVALVYTKRASERIAETFLDSGVAVVLILPFGPLGRKSVARTPTGDHPAAFAMVSVASASATWGRPIFAQSMKFLRLGSSCVLLSDPLLEWVNESALKSWSGHQISYIRYGNLSEEVRRTLDRVGAQPIGRRPDTGEPKVEILCGLTARPDRGVEAASSQPDRRFDLSLTPASARKLREIAHAIERFADQNEKVGLSIRCVPETRELCNELDRILATDAGHPDATLKKD